MRAEGHAFLRHVQVHGAVFTCLFTLKLIFATIEYLCLLSFTFLTAMRRRIEAAKGKFEELKQLEEGPKT